MKVLLLIIVGLVTEATLGWSSDTSTKTDSIEALDDLAYDRNGHLLQHYLLYSATAKCEAIVSAIWWGDGVKNRARRSLQGFDVVSQFGRELVQENDQVVLALQREELCVAVSLQQGAPRRLLTSLGRHDVFFIRNQDHHLQDEELLKWMVNLQRVEIGLTSAYLGKNTSVVHHIDRGQVRFQELEPGQHMSFHADIGSTITVLTNYHQSPSPNDPKKYIYTGDVVLSYEAQYHATLFTDFFEEDGGELVRQKTRRSRMSTNTERELFEDHFLEQTEIYYTEANRREMRFNLTESSANSLKKVKRTFSKMGFELGRLPKDLWASMATFYYNNKERSIVEFWTRNDVITNHYDVESEMTFVPFGLRACWQIRIQNIVANWINRNIGIEHVDLKRKSSLGPCEEHHSSKVADKRVISNGLKQCLQNAIHPIEVEQTSMYGTRTYKSGARLLHHVDKVATHAASVIINIAQDNITEPWPLEILDHSGRLHRVFMTEGDIVFYESARLLHGRISPLRGETFANIFAHYRPLISQIQPSDFSPQREDPLWYTRQNPVGTVEPMEQYEESRNRSRARSSMKGGGGRGVEERHDEFRFTDISSSGTSFDFNEGLLRLWDVY